MFRDRYIPDADDDYEPASSGRATSPPREEGGRSKDKQQKTSSKHHKSSKHGDKHRHREASAEDVEDGEIVDAAADAAAGAAAAAAGAPGQGSDEAGGLNSSAAAAANGKHRYPAAPEEDGHTDKSAPKGGAASPLGSPDSKQQPGCFSSKPPSIPSKPDRSRERSRDRSSKRDRDRDRHRSSRDRSQEAAPATAAAGTTSTKERSSSGRHRSRDRSRERHGSSRDRNRAEHPPSQQREAEPSAEELSTLPPPPRDRSSSRQRGADRDRERDRDRDRDSRRTTDDSRRGGGSSRYGSDGGGGWEQQRRRPGAAAEPMGYEARQRLRDSRDSRDSRGREGLDSRDRKRRSSRSRSSSRGRGEWRERERDYHDGRSYKRSRDDQGRDPHPHRQRRRSSSDEEAELDLDPAALLETDALGLSKAEKEAEEEARRLEESRRRRQAILEKHQQAAAVAAPSATAATAAASERPGDQQQQQQEQDGAEPEPACQQPQSQATEGGAAAAAAAEGDASPAAAAAAVDGTATPEGERSSSEDSHNAPGTPVMDIWNTGHQPSQQQQQGAAAGAGGDEASSRAAAAGEGQPEEELTSQLPVHLVVPGTEPNMQSERLRVALPHAAAAAGTAAAGTAAAAGAAAAADGDDMFADEDDMFAEDGGGEGGGGGAAAGVRRAAVVPAGLMDNYDDPEGYYNFQVGEVLDGRYEVFACKGKGVFSTVLRARDKLKLVPHPLTGAEEYAEVAIKVIRSNETMSKAAALEQRILRLLSDKDPDNRKHCIRMLRTFEYRHHVCMVFEPMDMNLRELTLKYGRNVGLNITAVGVYAAQLLVALRHLQQCGVLHADIKPDNILVNARRSKVKVCDLGSAMLAGENERTPYLISRFYRAPEVILGLAYDFPMDMWSVGCVLYELFTGKILFPGRTNNEMLKLMMDVKGPFPKKMLKKGIFVEKHFEPDAQLSFSLVEEDPVTKQPVRRLITNPTVKHNCSQLLARAEGDKQQVSALADLLEKMLALDPDKRISADAALRHDFVKPFLPKKTKGKH